MMQDGICVNLGDPLNSSKAKYAGMSQKRQELAKDLVEVGPAGSTPNLGKPSTWSPSLFTSYGEPRGSGWWKCNGLSD
jgi:hypothetical protein